MEDSRLIRLSGKADYTIGHSAGKDIFDREPSKELHLIAAEAKRDWPDESYWQCIAQTAALHKSRKQRASRNVRHGVSCPMRQTGSSFLLTRRASCPLRRTSNWICAVTTRSRCLLCTVQFTALSKAATRRLHPLRQRKSIGAEWLKNAHPPKGSAFRAENAKLWRRGREAPELPGAGGGGGCTRHTPCGRSQSSSSASNLSKAKC